MEKFASFILKHRKWILAAIAVLIVLAIVCTVLIVVFGKINSDMLTYLPEEMDTAKGQAFLSKYFNIQGDAMLVVQAGEGWTQGSAIRAAFDDIKKLEIKRKNADGKTETVTAVSQLIWYGTVAEYQSQPLFQEFIHAEELLSYLRQEAPREEWADENTPLYNYIVLGMLNASASSPEAFDTLSAMRDAFSSRGLKVASEGMTHTADIVMNDTLSEIPMYLVLGVLAVLLILLLSTESFIDPLILLITLGVSILIAMGSNLIFPSISIISFAISAILQLAVTMDYAIVFMHIYKQKLQKTANPEVAIKKAVPNAFGSILASGLTTVGGFAALFFMRFEIGADLGAVLIKAVVLSMISVIVLQPILTFVLRRATQKATHKSIKLSFEKTSRFVMKASKPILIAILLLLLPAFILQSLVQYSYFKMYDSSENPSSYQEVAAELRNQLVIAVPYAVNAESAAEGKTPTDFIADLKKDTKVKNVISIFSVMNKEDIDKSLPLIINTEVGKSFFANVTDESGSKTRYTLYTIILNGDVEDEASRASFAGITALTAQYFGDNYYTMGMLTGVNDMASVTPTDFLLVSLVSAAIIFLVLLLILRNLRQSVMLIIIIEIAIFINLSISVLTGINLNFMVYILISSVQLGCTVDYAILMATRYKDAFIETGGDRYESARLAFKNSVSAILISASIIISVCLCVLLISKNLIIRQMMELVARGGAVSVLVVLLSLPAFLACGKPTLSKKEKRQMAEDERVLSTSARKDEEKSEITSDVAAR